MKIGFISNEKYIKSLFKSTVSLSKAKTYKERMKLMVLIDKKKEEGEKITTKIREYFFKTVEEMGTKDTIIIMESKKANKTKKIIEGMGRKCEIEKDAYAVAGSSDCIILFFDRDDYYQKFSWHSKEFNIIRKALSQNKTVINLCDGKEEYTVDKYEFEETKDMFYIPGTEKDSDPYNHPISTSQRMIYESADFDYKNGNVLTVHEITDTKPYYYKINYVQNKIKCLPSEAEKLTEIFEYLNLSEKIVLDYLITIKTEGKKKLYAVLEDLGTLQKECIADEEENEKQYIDDEVFYYNDNSVEFKSIDLFNEEIKKAFFQEADIKNLTVGTEEEIEEINSIYDGGFQAYGFHIDNPFAKVPIGCTMTEFDLKVQEGKYSKNPLVQNLAKQIKDAENSKEIASIRKRIYKLQHGEAKTTSVELPTENEYTFLWTESKGKKMKLIHCQMLQNSEKN